MTGRGRPLRFLALVALGWTGSRLLLLWPQAGSLPEAIRAVAPRAPVLASGAGDVRRAPHVAFSASGAASRRERPRAAGAATRDPVAPTPSPRPGLGARPDPFNVTFALWGLNDFSKVLFDKPMPRRDAAPVSRPVGQERLSPLQSPWSASAWFVARGGSSTTSAPAGGQLGGSQAGARLAYLLSPSLRLAAFARVTSPLQGKGREAALGLEWQPTRAPVRLVAERRFGLDGTRGGPGLALVAGVYREMMPKTRVDAYGQAGAIHRGRLEPYADGAIRITRDAGDLGRARLSLGVGAWGGAQRDATRLDLGPTAALTVPVAGKNLRVAVDWRQRVAGNVRPGSGPALTVGMDF